MTVNLIDRTPVPGSLGVAPSTNILVHIQTTGTVASTTVTVKVDGLPAITAGVFQPGYAGTLVTDGAGGWFVTVNPSANLAYGATTAVRVQCVEQPGSVAFDQTYSFLVRRDIQIQVSVRYYEDGDVVEADLYGLDGLLPAPALVDRAAINLVRFGRLVDTLSIDNRDRQAAAGDMFAGRFLHPKQIARDMTWSATAAVDPYGAPGIGTLQAGGTIEWVPRMTKTMLGSRQPGKPGDTLPRTLPHENSVLAVQQDAAAQYEVVDVADSRNRDIEPTLLAELDFTNTTNYLRALAGDLAYTGGGNRVLPGVHAGDFFLQEVDELPVTFGARTLVEAGATNLLANSDLLVDPLVATAPDPLVRIERQYGLLCPGVRTVEYTVEGSVTYDGNLRNIVIASPRVLIAAGQPVTASYLTRSVLRDPTVTLDTFITRVRFFDGAGLQVLAQDFAFDIRAVESTDQYSLIEASVPALSIPVTAVRASFDILLGTFEGCDRVLLVVTAPVIENAAFATSRVVGGTAPIVRLADNLTVPQAGNINQRTGQIAVEYAPQYDGLPPADAAVFDTRSAILRSGYALRHRADGRLELLAADDAGGTVALVTTDPVTLAAGEPVTLAAVWAPGLRTITVDRALVAQASGPYTQPILIPANMTVGRLADSTQYLHGDVRTFRSYGVAS